MVLFLIFAGGIKSLGPWGFIKNMIPKGAPLLIGLIILVIELLGFFIKAFALCLRLFANMIAGHIVILALLVLIFILHPIAVAISVPLALFINILELLVALIQALVFTLLSCIFVAMACHHH
jgi:F-type H+-transporting ATPase subunit a